MRTVSKYLLYLSLACVFVYHFSMIALATLPPSPLTIKLKAPEVYTNGILRQEWGFFAPDPIRANDTLQVQCINSMHNVRTNFLDVTNSINSRLKDSLLYFSYERIGYIVTNTTLEYVNSNEREYSNFCSQNKNG